MPQPRDVAFAASNDEEAGPPLSAPGSSALARRRTESAVMRLKFNDRHPSFSREKRSGQSTESKTRVEGMGVVLKAISESGFFGQSSQGEYGEETDRIEG